MTYDNMKSYKKTGFHPLFRKYIFDCQLLVRLIHSLCGEVGFYITFEKKMLESLMT